MAACMGQSLLTTASFVVVGQGDGHLCVLTTQHPLFMPNI